VQELLGASGSREVSDFVDTIVERDLATGLRQINRLMDEGLDLRQLNRQIVEHLRSLMLIKSGAAASSGVTLDATEETIARMREQAGKATMADLLQWVNEFAGADSQLRATSYRQLPLEMALARAVLGVEAAPARVDRSTELAAGISEVGVLPTKTPDAPQRAIAAPRQAQRNQPAPPQHQTVEPDGPPPPIHSELQMPPPIEQAPELPEQPPMFEPELAAQEEAPAPDDAAASGDDLEKLKSLWPRVIDQINARSKNVAVVFRDSGQVRPSSVQGNLCTIAFRYPIHAERSRKEPARSVIEESISRVMGRAMRIESILFEQEGGEDDPDNSPSHSKGNGSQPAKPPSPYETARGKAALNIFNVTQFDDVE
jgi:DNA polymerase-3 subunit gamma/tau